ncbi:MAG: hypothetical protein HY658_09635, partial [Actinobacteria bacterium]|nr:hypothetical protein [Actinomycetota bacterium]
AYAGLLYLLHPRALLQLALLTGLAATLETALALQDRESSTAHALALWALGGAWIALSAVGVVKPRRPGVGLGALAALIGPSFGGDGGLAWLGAVTAAALMGFGVLARETVAMGFGAGGLFVYVTWLLGRASDTLGAPLVLLLAGLVLIVLAVVTARLIRYTSRREPAAGSPAPEA